MVIVNPTAPVGDHDFRPTPTGKIVVDFLRGAMPAYLDTGLNVVYVGDVAAGHLLACERGRAGERYILGGENLTLQQIFGKLEEVTGMPAPKLRIPYAVAYAAGVASTGWAAVTGKEPRAPLDGVRMARKKMWVRHDKAARELGYSARPAVEALRRAAEWFQANGYCEGPGYWWPPNGVSSMGFGSGWETPNNSPGRAQSSPAKRSGREIAGGCSPMAPVRHWCSRH